jgi:copper transporter 1
MFAGSCIGVILLVMSLEFIRRGVKEFDRYIIAKHASSTISTGDGSGLLKRDSHSGSVAPTASGGYRPTFVEQLVRAFLHMVQFAVAYFVML